CQKPALIEQCRFNAAMSGTRKEKRVPRLSQLPGMRWRQGAAIAVTAGLLTFAMAASGQGQGNDLAGLQVRLSQLEEQQRINSGQIEGLQFQLTQLQSLIERMQEDNEFRFQRLE